MCLVRWGTWGEDKNAADMMYTNKVRSQALSPCYLTIATPCRSPHHPLRLLNPLATHPAHSFNFPNMVNTTAELGAALAQVIPHPLYNPLAPPSLKICLPVPKKDSRASPNPPVTSPVCIRDLIVSAGKQMKLYATPAAAPPSSCWYTWRGARDASLRPDARAFIPRHNADTPS